MRFRPLPLVPLLAACAASDAAEPVLIEDFIERSVAVRCEPVPAMTARASSVADLATLSDSTLIVLYEHAREVAILGPDLEIREVVAFDADGPTGVRGPVSATLAGDTLIIVADQPRQRLKLLDLEGRDRGTVDLPFPPQRVQAAPSGIYITPFVMGRHPTRLLHRWDGAEVEPFEIPTVRYGDAGINALANMAGVAAFPDGRLIVTHEFVEPFAHRVPAGSSGASAERIPVPLPAATASALRRLPSGPLSEVDAGELPVATISAAPDAASGDLLILTRSGRFIDGRYEKAVIRFDEALGLRRSYLLDVNAIRMAYLANRGVSVIVDEVDQWYTCRTE